MLVLILAIGALVLPFVLGMLRERSFDAAADVTSQQLVLARAHAQETGEPIEVAYITAESRIVVRRFDPAAPPELFAHTGEVELDEAPDDDVVREPWARYRLPVEMRIAVRPPTDAATTTIDDELAAAPATDVETPVLRLAVFMPDGSALLGETAWLLDDDGRQGRFAINPWSGIASFERVEPGVAGGGSNEDERPADDEGEADAEIMPEAG